MEVNEWWLSKHRNSSKEIGREHGAHYYATITRLSRVYQTNRMSTILAAMFSVYENGSLIKRTSSFTRVVFSFADQLCSGSRTSKRNFEEKKTSGDLELRDAM